MRAEINVNKYLYIIAIAAVAILSSCHKSDNLTGPPSVMGKFIVDSVGTDLVVKTDTVSKNLETFIVFSLVYHYENYLGILEDISIDMANSYGVSTEIDYAIKYTGRENIPAPDRFNNIYEFPDSLSGKDSVKIFRRLSGSFFTVDSSNVVRFIGQYSWNDSLYVRVER